MKVIVTKQYKPGIQKSSSSSPHGSTSTLALGIITSSMPTFLSICLFPLPLLCCLCSGLSVHLCTEEPSGSALIHPPHWGWSDRSKMQPNPVIMALAEILHQLLKAVWIPLKALVRNHSILQNVAPLPSGVTSARSSQSPQSPPC